MSLSRVIDTVNFQTPIPGISNSDRLALFLVILFMMLTSSVELMFLSFLSYKLSAGQGITLMSAVILCSLLKAGYDTWLAYYPTEVDPSGLLFIKQMFSALSVLSLSVSAYVKEMSRVKQPVVLKPAVKAKPLKPLKPDKPKRKLKNRKI